MNYAEGSFSEVSPIPRAFFILIRYRTIKAVNDIRIQKMSTTNIWLYPLAHETHGQLPVTSPLDKGTISPKTAPKSKQALLVKASSRLTTKKTLRASHPQKKTRYRNDIRPSPKPSAKNFIAAKATAVIGYRLRQTAT